MTRISVCIFLLAACLAAGWSASAKAYEGPEERALDRSLQQYQSQENAADDSTSQLNRATPARGPGQPGMTASAGSQPEDPTAVEGPPARTSTEGPEEKALDRSLMNYRLQQDSANGAPTGGGQ